jgi:hypothetical protein
MFDRGADIPERAEPSNVKSELTAADEFRVESGADGKTSVLKAIEAHREWQSQHPESKRPQKSKRKDNPEH